MNPPPTELTDASIELIVFDWDGTLVDSTGAIANAIRGAAQDLGLVVPSFERASHVIGLGLADALRHAVPDLTPDKVDEFSDRYRHHFVQRAEDLVPFDGVQVMLDDLKASPTLVAIATGKSRAGLDRALQDAQWQSHFIDTRCADEGPPKPHPWMLNDLCETLGVAPANTVMVGDTTHDLNMAQEAGTHSVAVSYGAHPAEQLKPLATAGLVHGAPDLHALLTRMSGR
jgi:phosphoglycolate phosphatase